MSAITNLILEASKLTEQEQLALNKALCEMIRRNRKINQVVAGTSFTPGQIVRFDAKRKGIKHIKIEKFNRAGTAVVGYECNREGNRTALPTRWTVATNICVAI